MNQSTKYPGSDNFYKNFMGYYNWAVWEDVASDWDSILSKKIYILKVGASFGSIW